MEGTGLWPHYEKIHIWVSVYSAYVGIANLHSKTSNTGVINLIYVGTIAAMIRLNQCRGYHSNPMPNIGRNREIRV